MQLSRDRNGRLCVLGALLLAVCLQPLSAGADDGMVLKWKRVNGLTDPGAPTTLVGTVMGVGVPWSITDGKALLHLMTGAVTFRVQGLTLAASPLIMPGGTCCAALIGTTGVVTKVRGTLVCNATAGVGSVLVDTPPVPLSPEGNASFSGNVGGEAGFALCSGEPDDIAFLVRVAETSPPGVPIVDRWIAHGAVRTILADE